MTGRDFVTGKTADAVVPLTAANQGTDTVHSTINYTLGTGLENLTLDGTAPINGTGNAAANVIIGNSGNNVLTGGAGVDTMTGNGGADTFVFGVGDTGATQATRDVITDFAHGSDKLDVSALDQFRFLGSGAFDGQADALHAVYDAGKNITLVEGDINGDKVADFGIELTGNVTLDQGDFTNTSLLLPLTLTGDGNANTLTGGRMGDSLSGAGGDDTLIGNDGDDILDGGTGADKMTGGKGNDTYYVDLGTDVVAEASSPNEGTDLVISSINYLLGAGLENLTLKSGAGNINGTGNAAANVILGNEGANVITGGAGTDTLTGGTGADTFIFGAGDTGGTAGTRDLITDFEVGTDKLDFSSLGVFNVIGSNAFDGKASELRAVYDSTRNVTILEGDVNKDKVADFSIELAGNLKLGPTDFTPATAIQPLTLTGDGNANTLTGAALNDTLYGLGGDDNLTGNEGDDVLDGGTGADKMDGGKGNDTFYVDNPGDFITSYDGSGTQTVVASIDYVMGAVPDNLILKAGAGAINGTGNSYANVIIGNESNNIINGGRSADTLTGGGGADTFVDEDFDTFFTGRPHAVVTDFQQGTDKLAISGTSYTYIGNQAFDGGPAELRSYYDSDQNLTIIEADIDGNKTVDLRLDLIGQYTLQLSDFAVGTLATAKTLVGDDKDNSLTGGNANDSIQGQGGNDSIWGLSGDDVIDGGTGEDQMSGYYGNDTFYVDDVRDIVFEAGETSQGIDTVIASVDYTLTGSVENLVLAASAGNIDGFGNTQANVITGNSGNNLLGGGAGVDTLTGGGGMDVFIFAAGDTGGTAGARDRITDFVSGADQLDFWMIDADSTKSGHQVFQFIGATEFTGQAGEMRAYFDVAHNITVVEGDVDGDKAADFGVELSGNVTLVGNDFSPLVKNGDDGANTIAGTSRRDFISSAGGNDTITPGASDDIVDGGKGTDTVVLTGKVSEYQIVYTQGGVRITDLNGSNGDDGTDTLFNVERVQFSDRTIGISSEPILIGGAPGEAAGAAVGAAGDVNNDGYADLIIGAPVADGTAADSGAAYVVFGGASGLPDVLDLGALDGSDGFRLSGFAKGDYAGFSVGSAGDINGDGYADVVVGAMGADDNGASSGAAYVVFGKAGGFAPEIDLSKLDGTNGFKISGAAAGDLAGGAVHAAGDLNGDGIGDVIIGATGFQRGAAFVVFGKSTGFGSELDLGALDGNNGVALPKSPAKFSGHEDVGAAWSVSGDGDFNGDGIDDVVIGAPYEYGYGKTSGGAYIVLGHVGGFAASQYMDANLGSAAIRITGAAHGDLAGYSVAFAGDINGDGFDDIIIGSPTSYQRFDNVPVDGNAWVVFGTGEKVHNIDLSTLNGTNGFKIPGSVEGDETGYSVSGAGDVNGDGYADLLIGVPQAGGDKAGATYVLFGHAGGFGASFDLSNPSLAKGFWVKGDYAGDGAGFSVSAAGDINGDGFDDLLVGAPNADSNGVNSGAVEVIFGSDLLGLQPQIGTGGSNTLNGTGAIDTLNGRGGNDTLNGLGNDDDLLGGAGNDTIDGGAGNDHFAGGQDDDRLTGGAGNDTIDGGSGNDTAVFAGIRADYAVEFKAGTVIITDLNAAAGGNDGVDTLSGVEWLKFADQTVELHVPEVSKDLADLLGTGAYRFDGAGADQLGYMVANAGDVNGDGYDDMLLTAMSGDADGFSKAGRTFVVYGGSTNLAAADSADGVVDGIVVLDKIGIASGFRLDGGVANAFTGFSVSAAGDVNGDGYADIIVSGRNATAAGTSYVIYGGPASLSALDAADGKVDGGMDLAKVDGKTGFTIDGVVPGDQSGWSVTSTGDVNGDGFDDVVVGSRYGARDGNGHSGAAYVVYGGAGAAALDLADGKADGHLGLVNLSAGTGLRIDGFTAGVDVFVNDAGDVNGDGISDFTVASKFVGSSATTTVALIYGGAQHLSAWDAADGVVDGHATPGSLNGADGLRGGFSSLGDLNGDGISDLITSSSSGFFLAFGGGANLQALDGTDGQIDGIVGSSSRVGVAGYEITASAVLSAAGDVNGDGYDDLLVGTPTANFNPDGIYRGGAVYVVYGGATNLAALDAADGATDGKIDFFNPDGITGFRLDGAATNDVTGFSVSAAGDVNGDGYADLLIGAPWGVGGGKAYVVYGGDFTGDVTRLGTTAADTLNGTAAAETFVGAQGNDTLNGGGGADSLSGGNGDDQVHVTDRTFHRVDGGSGTDTLHLDFAGAIDFGNLDGNAATSDRGKISGIETIDVDNGQNNAMTLHLADILDIDANNTNVGGVASLDNVLKVDGNAGDTLHLLASEGWSAGDTSTLGGYAIYTHQAVRVAVDQDIVVTVS